MSKKKRSKHKPVPKKKKKQIKARVRKGLVWQPPQEEVGTPTIISPEIASARLEVLEGELARANVKLNMLSEYCRKTEPGKFPSRDAMEARELRALEKRLTDYLDVEHLEACRVTGVTPLFYVLALIDIKKDVLFRHPRWVLLPRPNLDAEEHTR